MATDEWLRYIERDRKRRPSTVNDYRQEIRHLLREFGAHTPLSEITTARVEAWRAAMVTEGRLSPQTINKRRQQLHAIFGRATKLYGLPSNPVTAVERQPDRPSGEFNVLDPAEIEAVAERADSAQDAAVFRLAAYTRLRMGELRALTWQDIDWVARWFGYAAPTRPTARTRRNQARSAPSR
jgi:integrase